MTARWTDEHLPTVLARLAWTLDGEFAPALRRARTDLPTFRALAALRDAPPPGETVTGLADLCMLQQPTMTKLLDRMTAAGLLARAPDPRDRRVVRVALTVGGVLRADELVALAEEHERRALKSAPMLAGRALPEALAVLTGREG